MAKRGELCRQGVMGMLVGRRRRGKQKRRWKDNIKEDMTVLGLVEEEENNKQQKILRSFFPPLWELAFCSPRQSPPFHSILCIISHQTSDLHVSLNHFLLCHFWSSPTSAPFYSHLHTLLHPIIP